MSQRIGVFGGTFDPPHLGHLILAAEAHAQLQLARLLWVVTAAPPHKEGTEITQLAIRVEMVRLAIHDNPAFELSTVDIDRPGPHYTVDTLRLTRQQHPEDRVLLILGGDSLRHLPTWHEPEAVVAEADELGVMRRPADEIDLTALEKLLPGMATKVRFIDAPLLEIASHEIRERARSGQPFRYYVPKLVHDYIILNRLYRDA